MLYCPPAQIDHSLLHYQGQLNGGDVESTSPSAIEGAMQTEVQIGKTVYPLRSALHEYAGVDTYWLEGFWPFVVGTGKTVESAKDNFQFQLHSLFQDLQSTPDFDRTEQKQKTWDLLSTLIDVTKYDQLRFLTAPELGRVFKDCPPRSRMIKWATGRREIIDIADAHPDFGKIALGKWFEAIVKREYLTGTFLEIEHITPVANPQFTAEERQQFWSSLSSD